MPKVDEPSLPLHAHESGHRNCRRLRRPAHRPRPADAAACRKANLPGPGPFCLRRIYAPRPAISSSQHRQQLSSSLPRRLSSSPLQLQLSSWRLPRLSSSRLRRSFSWLLQRPLSWPLLQQPSWLLLQLSSWLYQPIVSLLPSWLPRFSSHRRLSWLHQPFSPRPLSSPRRPSWLPRPFEPPLLSFVPQPSPLPARPFSVPSARLRSDAQQISAPHRQSSDWSGWSPDFSISAGTRSPGQSAWPAAAPG
ncbi:hypothetical protein D3C87_1424400 [compost metagenome]